MVAALRRIIYNFIGNKLSNQFARDNCFFTQTADAVMPKIRKQAKLYLPVESIAVQGNGNCITTRMLQQYPTVCSATD